MNGSSKYAGLASLIDQVGPSALAAADGFGTSDSKSGSEQERIVFPKASREADRRARTVARRLSILSRAVR